MSAPNKQAALHGIYLKMSALVLFCTMDAMVKALGGTYGSFQLMLFRSVIAMVPPLGMTITIGRERCPP